MSSHAKPVGGPIFTTPVKWLFAFLVFWAALVIYRFAVGIGEVSALTDGYPWGIWIAFDVVTAQALACGGYAIAILCYIFNKGKYHPLVRPAILTSALGYSLGAVAITIDIGRPWGMWRLPFGGFPDVGGYNWNSALLEVALCVMAYVGVLWIELMPALLEKWQAESENPTLRMIANIGLGFFDKALIWIVALGMVLPTMHQSSLGTVMLLGGHKLHPLWNTGWIPLLFLISCIGMGFAIVVWEATMSSRAFGTGNENAMLMSMSKAMVFVLGLFLVVRFADILISGKAGLMFGMNLMSLMFWIEIILFILPMIILLKAKTFSCVMNASILMIIAGALYRFDAYIVAYNPGNNWSYFPSLAELMITLGIVASEIFLYIVIVKRFPILSGAHAAGSAH